MISGKEAITKAGAVGASSNSERRSLASVVSSLTCTQAVIESTACGFGIMLSKVYMAFTSFYTFESKRSEQLWFDWADVDCTKELPRSNVCGELERLH